MAKKKVTRKELLKKPDEFLTFSAKMLNYVIENKNQLTIFLGIIVGVAIIISGIRYASEKSEENALAQLEQGSAKYEELEKDKGAEKAYLDVKADFQQILDKYSGKNGGKLARIVFANICYSGGDSDKAIELYKEALRDFNNNPYLKNFILNGLGYAHEKKKDYKAAADYFEKVASGPDSIMKDEAFFNLGRIYAELAEKEKSMEAYKKIVSEHEDSIYINLAKEKVSG